MSKQQKAGKDENSVVKELPEANKKTADTNNQEQLKAQLEQIKEMSSKVMKKLPLLGPVTWLYMNSRFHKHVFTNDLEWLVLPPIVLNQCKLYVKGDAPIAYVSWAFVSDDVAERLKTGSNRLAPHEWKSGEQLWLIDVAAPFGGLKELIQDLKENVFPDQDINIVTRGQNGLPDTQVL